MRKIFGGVTLGFIYFGMKYSIPTLSIIKNPDYECSLKKYNLMKKMDNWAGHYIMKSLDLSKINSFVDETNFNENKSTTSTKNADVSALSHIKR